MTHHPLRCRCSIPCVERNRAYMRRLRQRRQQREAPDHVHGTYNGYSNYGCRCLDCRDAGARHRKGQRERRPSLSISTWGDGDEVREVG